MNEHKWCEGTWPHSRHGWCLVDDNDEPIGPWYICDGTTSNGEPK